MTAPTPRLPRQATMNNDALNALLEIANGAPAVAVPADIQLPNVRAFVADLFLALSGRPITRPAMNALMDVLFALPACAPLLNDVAAAQADVANAINLPALPPLFRSHWEYIIVPAWNQEAQVRALANDQPQADRNQYAGLQQ